MKFGPDSTRFVDEPLKEPSASDGLSTALEEIRKQDEAAKPAAEIVAGMTEPSKPVEPEAPPAPALLVTGVGELDHTSANVESDRQRAYAIIAEIDAELKAYPDKVAGLVVARDAAQDVVNKANADLDTFDKRHDELLRTRAEAADRAISLGQILLDTEAARLRRGL